MHQLLHSFRMSSLLICSQAHFLRMICACHSVSCGAHTYDILPVNATDEAPLVSTSTCDSL
jgi:hypothetical protein